MAFTGFGNKTTATTASAFSFGSGSKPAASASGFSFGNTSKPAVGVVAPTLTNTSGISFSGVGNPATTSNLGGLNFGKTTTTTSSGFALNFGSSNTTTSNLLSTQPESKPTFTGLGGKDLSSTNANADNGNKSTGISQAVKDQVVPDEIGKYVNLFEEYVKKQRENSNEVGKFSVHSLTKIKSEITSLTTSLNIISSAVERNKVAVGKLKLEFEEQIKNSEMAQRTQDTPSALQHDNIAPIQYFITLATEFGSSMQVCRHQIEELENHLHGLLQPSSINPQDISIALCNMQDSFINLASNLHSVHHNIKQLKDQYLNYRRLVIGDSSDIFLSTKENHIEKSPPKQTGPPPFSNISKVAALAMASMIQPQTTAPPQQSFLKPGFTGSNTGTGNIFGNTAGTGLFGSSTTNKQPTNTGLFGTSKPATTTSGFGSSFSGFGSSNTVLKPALSAGYNKSTSGNTFFGNTTFNSSAGVTFGGSALKPFDLKTPLKRNKK